MKLSLLFCLMVKCLPIFSQTNDHVVFDYDVAGNQIKRYLIDINPGRYADPNIINIKNLTDENLIKADIYDDIKYYPNPVQEELFVQWELINDNHVSSIEVFSMSGQMLKSYQNLENKENAQIAFINYPQGIYNVVLFFKNGEQKSLKIVKR